MTDNETEILTVLSDGMHGGFDRIHARLAELATEQRMTREHFEYKIDTQRDLILRELATHDEKDVVAFKRIDSKIDGLRSKDQKLEAADIELRKTAAELKTAGDTVRHEALTIVSDARLSRLKFVTGIVTALIIGALTRFLF